MEQAPYPSFSSFVEQTETLFSVADDGGPLTHIELKSVVPASWASQEKHASQPSSFSILFEDRPGSALEQRTYALTHAELGAFDLFIVPVGLDKVSGNMIYEAVFN